MKLSVSQWTSVGLAVAALCSVAVVLATRSKPGTTERAERERNLIAVWREDEIRSVSFTSGKKSFRLERTVGADASIEKGGGFVLQTKDPEPADAASVDRLISGLGMATPVRRVEDADRHLVAMENPEAVLQIDMDGEKISLVLGKPAPSPAGASYVAVSIGNDMTLSVVSKEIAALLRMGPDDFRTRALVGIAKSDVRAVSLEYPSAGAAPNEPPRASDKVVLERLDKGGFRIAGLGRANRNALENLFGALSRLDAKRFLDPAEARRAQNGRPEVVVRVTPIDAKTPPVVVSLGGACPGFEGEVLALVEATPERAACVERALVKALLFERASFEDKVPFSVRMDEVETLQIERGDNRLVLNRQGSGLILVEPTQARIELDAGNARISAVLEAPAELVKNPDPKQLGLDPPAGRVVVVHILEADQAVEEILELGKTQPDGTLPARRPDGAVLAIGRDAARAFEVDATLLRKLRLADFALSALAELELSAPERQVLKRAPNGFDLAVPPGFLHDGALATDAVLALGSLTALRFVADKDDGSFGLATPALSALARFDADGGARSLRLLIGRATPGGFFAKLDGDPSVFVIERSVAERLGTLLIDRAALMADPSTLARVVITKDGVTRTLERKNDVLVPAPSSGIDPSVAPRLIEALGALRAEAAVHTGAARPAEGFEKPLLEVRYEPLPGLGKTRSFVVGTSGTASGPVSPASQQACHHARAAGIQATFLVADAKLKPLFDLF
jgi:hypothetical protein